MGVCPPPVLTGPGAPFPCGTADQPGCLRCGPELRGERGEVLDHGKGVGGGGGLSTYMRKMISTLCRSF